ncbi:MAG: biopolymer transporter ExbD [Candidatus Mcinerneyibacterium aminivorans]|uniref:Biopolymer transporter ExbD n=1 Tax=Candidatus Mcinerneyibacterium aminivorans TaxID=2703815 RepID=A0A5D0MHB8_9BACT|nr:MAG: biopolymer transporter ExbD [Candidatus Mcinerneyibacterium aminivorans]
MKFEESERNEININMVPLLDTIFILLIFFSLILISASYMKGIDINLPFSKNTEVIDKSVKVISITTEKELYYENNKYTEEKFWEKIENNKKNEFVIKADKNLKFGFVIKIMDRMRSMGIKKVHFELRPE